MRVLLVRLSHTTDVINTLPAVCAFRRDRPDAWIVYATHSEPNIDIVNSCQSVNECLAVPDLGGEDPEGEAGSPRSRRAGAGSSSPR